MSSSNTPTTASNADNDTATSIQSHTPRTVPTDRMSLDDHFGVPQEPPAYSEEVTGYSVPNNVEVPAFNYEAYNPPSSLTWAKLDITPSALGLQVGDDVELFLPSELTGQVKGTRTAFGQELLCVRPEEGVISEYWTDPDKVYFPTYQTKATRETNSQLLGAKEAPGRDIEEKRA